MYRYMVVANQTSRDLTDLFSGLGGGLAFCLSLAQVHPARTLALLLPVPL